MEKLWSDESLFQMAGLEFDINNLVPTCLVSTGQVGGGSVMVWATFFLAHFGPITDQSINQSLLDCSSLWSFKVYKLHQVIEFWPPGGRIFKAIHFHTVERLEVT